MPGSRLKPSLALVHFLFAFVILCTGVIDLCQNLSPIVSKPRGTGFIKAAPGDLPWQVRLEADDLCGGTIIGQRWVLTAAHCVYDQQADSVKSPEDITAHFGSLNISTTIPGEQIVPVSAVYKHDLYNPETNDYDFALLYLSETLNWSSTIKPACLLDNCSQEQPAGVSLCIISGWGTSSEKSDRPEEQLGYGFVPLVTSRECQRPYNESSDPDLQHVVITQNMICAGFGSGGIDTCRGDSGGPLICRGSRKGTFYLHGVTSIGNVKCGTPKFYGVYARVCGIRGWINNIMESEEDRLNAKKTKNRPRTITTTTTEPSSTTTGDYSF